MHILEVCIVKKLNSASDNEKDLLALVALAIENIF